MKRFRVGVIPAAGQGKRMGYLSQVLPKVLFPLYDKPIIHHVIDNMKGIGIEQFYVIVNYQKEKIIDYLESVKSTLGINISYIEQPELSGIAAAIMLTRSYINEPFVVILGDDCTISSSLDVIAASLFTHDAILVEGIVGEENRNALKAACCVKLNKNGRITEITEKPDNPSSNIRGCGIYLCQSEVFDYIEKTPVSDIRGEVEITQTIDLIARDGKAYGEFINGVNINVNSPEDLLQAWLLVKRIGRHYLVAPPAQRLVKIR